MLATIVAFASFENSIFFIIASLPNAIGTLMVQQNRLVNQGNSIAVASHRP
jgi:hypothetical protein